MNAMAPCPKDSAIMQTWETYKTSEEYKNSHGWATRYIPDDDPAELDRIRASGANPWTKQMKVQAVEGSLWAAFMHGWREAGGADPHKRPSPAPPKPAPDAEAALRLLQASSCFRGEVCASLPCACADSLANLSLPVQPTARPDGGGD